MRLYFTPGARCLPPVCGRDAQLQPSRQDEAMVDFSAVLGAQDLRPRGQQVPDLELQPRCSVLSFEASGSQALSHAPRICLLDATSRPSGTPPAAFWGHVSRASLPPSVLGTQQVLWGGPRRQRPEGGLGCQVLRCIGTRGLGEASVARPPRPPSPGLRLGSGGGCLGGLP